MISEVLSLACWCQLRNPFEEDPPQLRGRQPSGVAPSQTPHPGSPPVLSRVKGWRFSSATATREYSSRLSGSGAQESFVRGRWTQKSEAGVRAAVRPVPPRMASGQRLTPPVPPPPLQTGWDWAAGSGGTPAPSGASLRWGHRTLQMGTLFGSLRRKQQPWAPSREVSTARAAFLSKRPPLGDSRTSHDAYPEPS